MYGQHTQPNALSLNNHCTLVPTFQRQMIPMWCETTRRLFEFDFQNSHFIAVLLVVSLHLSWIPSWMLTSDQNLQVNFSKIPPSRDKDTMHYLLFMYLTTLCYLLFKLNVHLKVKSKQGKIQLTIAKHEQMKGGGDGTILHQ